MKILGCLWIFFLVLFAVSLAVAIMIEKLFDESHPVKKWWRRNVIAPDPEDAKYKEQNDDNQQ